jgi:hypothetical protein
VLARTPAWDNIVALTTNVHDHIIVNACTTVRVIKDWLSWSEFITTITPQEAHFYP